MSKRENWGFELEEYIRQGEPDQITKSEAWQTAIGLQAVDGLKTSKYLLKTAKEHIEGKIDIDVVQKRIQNYYEERINRQEIEDSTREADIVSSRIAAILGERTFQFSPVEWQEIHRRLFEGVLDYAGEIRPYNITKKEWVLKDDTVLYASHESIKVTLDYDFNAEKQFSYKGLSTTELVKHIAKFTSGIWQIHPFCEGNTRATAVFIIKYLRTMGFSVSNEVFADNSWYFRNALVRANYNNLQKGIHATTNYLEQFFENLLFNKHNMLMNRYLHLDYSMDMEEQLGQSAKQSNPKCQSGTLDYTADEMEIIKLISINPKITQKELAERLEKSERTIKRRTIDLQQKGVIQRLGGRRNGMWKIIRQRHGY